MTVIMTRGAPAPVRSRQRRPGTWPRLAVLEAEMFAPSINVDLEKLKGSEEAKPAAHKPKKVAARGGAAATKTAQKPASK